MSEVDVAYYLADGSTARARYPHDGNSDPIDAITALLNDKARSGKLLEVDSIDINSGTGSSIYIVPSQVQAIIVEKVFDLTGVA